MAITFDSSLFGCNAKISAGELFSVLGVNSIGALHNDSGMFDIEISSISSTIDTIKAVSNSPSINGKVAIYHAANDLICSGVQPIAANISIGIPPDIEQEEIKELIDTIKSTLGAAPLERRQAPINQ